VFTGLIAEVGTVADVRHDDDGAVLTVAAQVAAQLREGDSVAVDGVCLTASSVSADGFRAQAMRETLERSSLGARRTGEKVNLELPLRAGEPFGGHFVQGHVDGTGTVRAIREEGFSRVLQIALDERLAATRLLVEKGSVALDGVSLTVTAVDGGSFEVALIPETLRRTTLGALGEGERVNIELDMLAKHVERLLEAQR
jgi:riboflavin synthase